MQSLISIYATPTVMLCKIYVFSPNLSLCTAQSIQKPFLRKLSVLSSIDIWYYVKNT